MWMGSSLGILCIEYLEAIAVVCDEWIRVMEWRGIGWGWAQESARACVAERYLGIMNALLLWSETCKLNEA